MPKFRKKEVVVEAIQYDGTENSVLKILGLQDRPTNLITVEADGLRVNTPKGMMKANKHDWIIKGVDGELYTRKPDVFAKTYEPVEPQKRELYL